jgi:hypothetical protein
MAADTSDLMPGSQASWLVPASPAQAVIALIVEVAPEKLPGEITRAQFEHVIIGINGGRPGRTNVVSWARHGTMADASI